VPKISPNRKPSVRFRTMFLIRVWWGAARSSPSTLAERSHSVAYLRTFILNTCWQSLSSLTLRHI